VLYNSEGIAKYTATFCCVLKPEDNNNNNNNNKIFPQVLK